MKHKLTGNFKEVGYFIGTVYRHPEIPFDAGSKDHRDRVLAQGLIYLNTKTSAIPFSGVRLKSQSTDTGRVMYVTIERGSKGNRDRYAAVLRDLESE